MTAPSAAMFLVPPGKRWTVTLVDIAAADTLVPNGVTFTAETSGATGNEFNVGASDVETVVNAATAFNASSDVNEEISAHLTGPFTLDLATLANDDTLSLNGQQFKAKTSGANHTATPPEFNLGSDHGATDLAAQIVGAYGNYAGVSGVLGAVPSGNTVVLTGDLTAFVPPGTASHAVMTAAVAVLTLVGGLSSFSAAVADSDGGATLSALANPGDSIICIAQIVGGSTADSVSTVEPIALGVGGGSDPSAISFDLGASQVNSLTPLLVPASSTDRSAQFGCNGYSYQWDGSSYDYSITCVLGFAAAGQVTATPATLTLQNPSVIAGGS